MNRNVITDIQALFLELFGKQKQLSSQFYLSGGTALSGFYIPYRLSEDLDFFSETEIEIDAVVTCLKTLQNKLKFESFDLNTSFNRNIVILLWPDKNLKLEFTYYPFPQIDPPKQDIVIVDSVLDIATNKLFTIYQKPRSRDFMDLYMINKKYNFSFDELIQKAKIKFDWHVDPLRLGSQLLLVTELKDYPYLLLPLGEKEWQEYFTNLAKQLGKQVIK